jgi:hypothetical protein
MQPINRGQSVVSFCCSCLRRSQAQSIVYIVRKKRKRCLIYLDCLFPITSPLDVSSVINQQPIGGINEPVIGQRKESYKTSLGLYV